MRSHRLLTLIAGLLVLPGSALATGTGASAKPAAVKISTGTYLAKVGTSSFRFKVEGYTPTDRCGTSPRNHCFISLTYPKVKAPCQNGQAEDNAFSVPDGFINSSGHFSYHQTGPLISFSANVVGSHVTGTLREVDVYDDGDGNVSCDTGVVHWSAKLQ